MPYTVDMTKHSIGEQTFRLFNRPSFWIGFVGLLDFRPNIAKYRTSESEREADAQSIAADWVAVGADLKTAILSYGGERK
jgi:hypothetical protein